MASSRIMTAVVLRDLPETDPVALFEIASDADLFIVAWGRDIARARPPLSLKTVEVLVKG